MVTEIITESVLCSSAFNLFYTSSMEIPDDQNLYEVVNCYFSLPQRNVIIKPYYISEQNIFGYAEYGCSCYVWYSFNNGKDTAVLKKDILLRIMFYTTKKYIGCCNVLPSAIIHFIDPPRFVKILPNDNHIDIKVCIDFLVEITVLSQLNVETFPS